MTAGPPDLTVRRRAVTVTAVDLVGRTATVRWADGATSTAGVPWLSSYAPVAGDTALVDLTAGSPLLLGATRSGRVGCTLRRAAAQSITSGTPNPILWDTEDEDTSGFIAVTSGTVTIPAGYDGVYTITCRVNHQAVEATFHSNRNYVDIAPTSTFTGTPASFRQKIDSVEDQAVVTVGAIRLAAGDTFVSNIFQDTGAGQNLAAAWLTCYRISP
jgi:hypothetical protein